MEVPRVFRSKKFKSWHKSLSKKQQAVVDTRIDVFIEYGVLLNSKLLDSRFSLFEFKWISGLRVYYAFIEDSDGRLMLLLIGGNKNTQQSDIAEAKNILLKAINKISTKSNNLRKIK